MEAIISLLALLVVTVASLRLLHTRRGRGQVPVSINYHFTRRCNYTCGFCFHTASSSYIEAPGRAKEGLRPLAHAGMKKLNFAGGEPFLYPKFLGEMIDFCKQDLHLESVSVVTNGSLVRESFLRKHGKNLDILAVSCDSFDEATNIQIGRGSGDQVKKLYQIAGWCEKYGILFKINTVVNRLNHTEDMNAHLGALKPFRWKCFQVLIVAGENDTTETLRNGHKFTISDEEFGHLMAKSYLILDEYLRFLDRTGKQPSRPLFEVGVKKALESVFWDEDAFLERGGLYDWVKPKTEKACGAEGREDLVW
ncbi:hypothetical protein QBC44DRAFT_344225 [Cladorrhinum sp. PSN332]|nr:hypothetical protein QBC44DRAFT_344225 [Cladorrhinum sp. PSN332]